MYFVPHVRLTNGANSVCCAADSISRDNTVWARFIRAHPFKTSKPKWINAISTFFIEPRNEDECVDEVRAMRVHEAANSERSCRVALEFLQTLLAAYYRLQPYLFPYSLNLPAQPYFWFASVLSETRPTTLINTDVMEQHTAYTADNDVLFAMTLADAYSTRFGISFLLKVSECRSAPTATPVLKLRCLRFIHLFLQFSAFKHFYIPAYIWTYIHVCYLSIF